MGFARSAGESLFPGLWRGKVAHYAMVLGPTGGRLVDVSGYNNHGTLNNFEIGADWKVALGAGWCLDFDGVDEDVTLTAASQINNLSPLTYLITGDVINIPSNTTRVLEKGVGDGFALRDVGAQPNTLKFERSFSSTALVVVALDSFITQGIFTTFGVTWDGGLAAAGVKMYNAGVEAASYQETQDAVGTLDDDSGNALILGDSNAGNVNYRGFMHEVIIYNRVLSPAEMLFSAQLPYASLMLRDSRVGAIEQAAVAGRTRRAFSFGD